MTAARGAVAELVGTSLSRVALVDNATTGAACVASSLGRRWVTGEWAHGDIVLVANYTYDSVEHAFRSHCEAAGARAPGCHARVGTRER